MLWLERLEVNGFKSFSDNCRIDFPRGVTAVVGPNGCGKSNIADAIQWVLGEQSARALRGQRMEDVIFAGTQGRGPGGMAEVSLHLVPRTGDTLADGRQKVQLTRRLFRSGASEYLIDGKKSRLADVRALLDHVRAGVRSYAIVDQANVAAFVISKAKDRRVFIEEAAGIAGFKQRRRLAELKLEATRANLLRIDDIVGEVERQQRSLKRQAGLARRARRLEERLRALRQVWYRRRDSVLAGEVQRLEELLGVSRREADHLAAEKERVADGLAAARAEVEHAHGERDQAVEQSHAARLEEERLEREMHTARAQAESLDDEAGRRAGEGEQLVAERRRRDEEIERLDAVAAGLGQELVGVEQRAAAAFAQVDAVRRRHEQLREESTGLERQLFDAVHRKAELSARLSAAEEAARREEHRAEEAGAACARLERAVQTAGKDLDGARRAAEEASAAVERLQLEVQRAQQEEEQAWQALEQTRATVAEVDGKLRAARGEKHALDSLDVRLAGADAARQLLERAGDGRIAARQVIADVLAVDEEVEQAAELFLADVLPAVLVDSSEDARVGAGLGIRGRLRLLPLDAGELPEAETALPPALAAHPGVRGRLASHVRPVNGLGRTVTSRLRDAVLVDSLDTALTLFRSHPGYDFLTPEGHAVHANGMVTIEGGADGDGEGLLARARRREELAREIDGLEQQAVAAASAVEQARERHAGAQVVRRRVEEELAEARRRLASSRLETGQIEREIERLRHELELSQAAGDAAREALGQARERATNCGAELGRVETEIEQGRAALETARTRVREHETDVREAEAAHGVQLAEQRALQERQAAAARERQRLQAELEGLEQRRQAGDAAREQARERARALREKADRDEQRLAGLSERRASLEKRVESWAERLARMNERVHEIEARLDRVGEEFEQARARREQAALEAERARIELQHERQGCLEELGAAPEELPADDPEGIEEEILASDALLEQELASVRGRRERLGAVNLLAETEFDELSRRFEELSGQRDDLRASVDQLESSIRKINRESRERFLEAFGAIRQNFREQFTVLFRGGKGDLLLQDEEDVLDSGIEIMCQPPGKKLQSVNLLSGGEKALAATAMLFAIFRYQPPPFCLLDEIDAPLDDTNVHRFTEAVRGFASSTQIILITHNKRSMETADMLYGVTMPEPGVSRLMSMTLD